MQILKERLQRQSKTIPKGLHKLLYTTLFFTCLSNYVDKVRYFSTNYSLNNSLKYTLYELDLSRYTSQGILPDNVPLSSIIVDYVIPDHCMLVHWCNPNTAIGREVRSWIGDVYGYVYVTRDGDYVSIRFEGYADNRVWVRSWTKINDVGYSAIQELSTNDAINVKTNSTPSDPFGHVNYIYALQSSHIVAGVDRLAQYGGSANVIWSIGTWSDKRLKTNIKDSTLDGIDFINSLKLRSFDYINEKYGSHKENYFIAQELQEFIPEAVASVPTTPEQKEELNIDEIYTVDEAKIVPYLTKAVQELSQIVKQQQKQINELKSII